MYKLLLNAPSIKNLKTQDSYIREYEEIVENIKNDASIEAMRNQFALQGMDDEFIENKIKEMKKMKFDSQLLQLKERYGIAGG